MRTSLFSAVAVVALASTPAQAAGPYVGVDGGLLSAKDMSVDRLVFQEGGTTVTAAKEDFTDYDLKRGVDIDLNGGYDFGLFRVEAELAYKRAPGGKVEVDQTTLDVIGLPLTDSDFDLDGAVTVRSLMVNAMVDLELKGIGLFAGGGLGRARVKTFGDSDGVGATQLFAGVRVPLSGAIDASLKYRYFRTDRVDYLSADMDTGGPFTFDGDAKFRSHSVLVGLSYGFGGKD